MPHPSLSGNFTGKSRDGTLRIGILQVNHDKSEDIGDRFPMIRTGSVTCSTSWIRGSATVSI